MSNNERKTLFLVNAGHKFSGTVISSVVVALAIRKEIEIMTYFEAAEALAK